MQTKDSRMQSAYVEKARAQLDEVDARLRDYRARAREQGAGMRARTEAEIDRLKDMRDRMEHWIAATAEAGADAWDDTRTGLDRAWTEMARAMQQAAARFD